MIFRAILWTLLGIAGCLAVFDRAHAFEEIVQGKPLVYDWGGFGEKNLQEITPEVIMYRIKSSRTGFGKTLVDWRILTPKATVQLSVNEDALMQYLRAGAGAGEAAAKDIEVVWSFPEGFYLPDTEISDKSLLVKAWRPFPVELKAKIKGDESNFQTYRLWVNINAPSGG
ncbi:MAG: hypothetical protein OXU62_00695 [Gammaproteobacteria bacterium]|nr:hypothetical protein [Gammaproteobacteria bacterium]